MRNLTINAVSFDVLTESHVRYGATVKFEKGINVIYGPNSVGKSSILTGILYGLGAEKGLGVGVNQNPFKPEFYDIIGGEKIKSSYVLLEITNGDKTVSIKREILGKNQIAVVKQSTIANFRETTDEKRLIADGKGVMSEQGLQKFLFDFLDWNVVEISTYEGGTSLLYFENLLPLFFIEQRTGYSQIQARQVTKYGIRDVKKITFEYLMGLDKFEIHLVELQRRVLKEEIDTHKLRLETREHDILVQANATQGANHEMYIEKVDQTRVEINEHLKALETQLNEKRKVLQSSRGGNTKENEEEDRLKDSLRRVSSSRRLLNDKVHRLTREISTYKNYIERIELNRKKNLQLKRLEEINDDTKIAQCPVCHSKLMESAELMCQLCKSKKPRISTAEENLNFLEDEKSSFIKILEVKTLELEGNKEQYKQIKEEEESLQNALDFLLETTQGNKELRRDRELAIETDRTFREIERYKLLNKHWKELEKDRHHIQSLQKKESSLLETIEQYKSSQRDERIMGKVLEEFRKNLEAMQLFKHKRELLNEIDLEPENYTPYLKFYDLYNINSSSDNVRVILGYYLSLLQAALSLDDKGIKFPSLLVIDEPKQQNLDKETVLSFMQILAKLPKETFQVIITTFENRESPPGHFAHEMMNPKDYLLKKIA